MKTRAEMRAMVALSAALALGACGAPARETAPEAASGGAAAPARAGHTEADARFMRGMIGHHAQALEMTALVPSRAASPGLRLLAERIEVSQRDEIAQMERWLTSRGEPLPAAHAHHGAGHQMVAGMLTPEEMARLAAATGAEFDRLFLELMIRHHEGALEMVAELFASPGATRESDTFQIASDVDADQRSEIARMRMLLAGEAPGRRR